MPLIVFVTAYQEYAIEAFRVNALDYLLKPVARDVFRDTIMRIKASLISRNQQDYLERLTLLLSQTSFDGNSQWDSGQQSFKQKYVAIKQGERIFPVHYDSIFAVEASGNYLTIYTEDGQYKIRSTLAAFLQQASHKPIQQINRSVAVHLECVKEIQKYFKGDYAIVMKNGLQFVTSSKYRGAIANFIY